MKQSAPNYFIIVPAAGIGTRMESDIPKQYIMVKNKCIIEYTLNTLLAYSAFEKCVVVINAYDKNWHSLKLTHPKLITTTGGTERANSVLNGLIALKPFIKNNDWVLVHDAARPFLHASDIDKLITELSNDSLGGLLGSPLKNTIKRIQDNRCFATLDRQHLWHALTPQMFRYHWIFKALNSAIEKKQTVTDESSAIELLGKHPKIIAGRADNIKITDRNDLDFFNYCLQA